MGIVDHHQRTYTCDFPGCEASHSGAHDMGSGGFRRVIVDAGDRTQIYDAVFCDQHNRAVHAELRKLGFGATERFQGAVLQPPRGGQ